MAGAGAAVVGSQEADDICELAAIGSPLASPLDFTVSFEHDVGDRSHWLSRTANRVNSALTVFEIALAPAENLQGAVRWHRAA